MPLNVLQIPATSVTAKQPQNSDQWASAGEGRSPCSPLADVDFTASLKISYAKKCFCEKVHLISFLSKESSLKSS